MRPVPPYLVPLRRYRFDVCTAALVLLTLAWNGATAYAQESLAQGVPPCGPGIELSEIAISVDQPVTLRVYDGNGVLLTPTRVSGGPVSAVPTSEVVLPQTASRDQCSAYVSFQNDSVHPDAMAITYPDTYPGQAVEPVYTIELRRSSSVVQRFLYADRSPSATGWCEDAANGTGIASFFCVREGTLTNDNSDVYLGYRGGQFEASPQQMWFRGGSTASFVHETFGSDDGWVWPYHGSTICAQGNCRYDVLGTVFNDREAGLRSKVLLMPVDSVVVLGAPMTKRISKTMALPENGIYDWVEDWLTLAFEPGAGITIESDDFRAAGLTFEESAPGAGWDGLYFRGQSVGTLENVRIQHVGSTTSNPFAVKVVDATVLVSGGLISEGRHNASGIRVSGPASHVEVSDVDILDMPRHGVLVTGEGRIEVYESFISENSGSGIVATTDAEVYVGSPTAGSRGTMANEVVGNALRGVQALTGAAVRHAMPGDVSGPKHSGYNYVVENDRGGIEARTGATHYAGVLGSYARDNWFEDNGQGHPRYTDGVGPDALVRDDGSAAYANLNWWGRPADPDTLAYHGTTHEAYIDVDPMLTAAPAAVGASAAAVSPPPDPEIVTSDPLTAAVAPLEEGGGPAALALVIGQRPGTSRASAALNAVGSLAAARGTDRTARAAALAVLRRESRSPSAHHRAWARYGLVRSYRASGDRDRAIAEAEALVADAQAGAFDGPSAPVPLLLGHLALAYDRARTGDAAGAWASWTDAAALADAASLDDGVSLDAARDDLAEITGGAPPAHVRGGARVRATAPLGSRLSAPYPNPTAGSVVVPYHVAEAGPVRLVVADVLGREVAVLTDEALDAGPHAATLDGDTLAPGTYVVRLTVGGETAARPFAVVR